MEKHLQPFGRGSRACLGKECVAIFVLFCFAFYFQFPFPIRFPSLSAFGFPFRHPSLSLQLMPLYRSDRIHISERIHTNKSRYRRTVSRSQRSMSVSRASLASLSFSCSRRGRRMWSRCMISSVRFRGVIGGLGYLLIEGVGG
jgi:hypothetical protein